MLSLLAAVSAHLWLSPRWTAMGTPRFAHPTMVVPAFAAEQAAAADTGNACKNWRLALLPDPSGKPDLHFALEHSVSPPAGKRWAFYGFSVAGGPTVLSLRQLSGGTARPLERIGSGPGGKPAYALAGWYPPEASRTLYLIRLETGDARLAKLEVQAHWLPEGFQRKFHGPLPEEKILPLAPGRIDGLGEEALVCRVQRP